MLKIRESQEKMAYLSQNDRSKLAKRKIYRGRKCNQTPGVQISIYLFFFLSMVNLDSLLSKDESRAGSRDSRESERDSVR